MTNQHILVDHNYNLPFADTNIVDDNKLKDHDYFLSNAHMADNKNCTDYEVIDHNYFLPAAGINIINNNQSVNQQLIEHNYCLPGRDFTQQCTVDSITNNVNSLYCKQATTYSILPGVRLNSQVYMDDLFHRYYKHSSRNFVIYLVCENKKNKCETCPVIASISVNLNDNRIKTTGQHNHLPRLVDIPMVHLRRAIGLLGTNSRTLSTPAKQLYNREKVNNPEGAKNYTLSQSQLSVRRMRRRYCRRLTDLMSIQNVAENVTMPENLPSNNKNYVYKRKLEDAQVNIKTLHLQKAVTYSIIPGARQNSRIYMDNLWYRYYKNRTLNCVIYLVCENQKNNKGFCPVIATVSVDENDKTIKTTGQHNHLPRYLNNIETIK